MMENRDYSRWHFGGISSGVFSNVTIFIVFLFVRKMEITVCYVRQSKMIDTEQLMIVFEN